MKIARDLPLPDIEAPTHFEQAFLLKNDNGADISFTGSLVGKANTSHGRANRDYSGRPGHWTVLRLYRTNHGVLVAEKVDYSQRAVDSGYRSVQSCTRLDEVASFFGHNALARELYKDAGLDAAHSAD